MRRLGDRPGFKASASGPLGGPRLTSVLMALAAMALIVTGSAGADQSYTDPQGDAGVGTDIVAVTVRNDAAGNLSFQVGSASPIVSNHAIAIFVNADRNKSTGASSTGDDFVMFGGPATGVAFAAWNGSQFVATNPPSYHVGAATSNVTDFRISKADLGNTSGFDFAVISVSEDPPDPNLHFWDYAPNAGVYTYTLTTPAPPPSTNPPPAPKPPPTSRPDPNKLPTIFGPSARSRKDPEYSRFATRMAGGPRSVFCWNKADWARLNPASKTTITEGYVEYRSPHQINLAPDVCSVLDRIYYHHQRPPIMPAVTFGLVTFTYEMFHTLGISNEAAAQCYGMQYAWRAARLLGAGADFGQRVAQLAWRMYNGQVLPPQYLSRECRNGGKLDLYPKVSAWP